ncbi:MAG: hypothetical protein ABSH03_12430 [Candidatus Lustribacter sp.]|jgi:hypothetical protein
MSKPVYALCCIAALLVAVSGAPASAQTKKVAPADEYFGRQKLSILGIGNMIKDMRLRIETDMSKSATIYGTLADVENAIHDWEGKYPADSWVPKHIELLEAVYFEVPDDHARQLGMRIEAWLVHDYPRSAYAVTGRKVMLAAAHPMVVPPVSGVEANAPAPADPAADPH